MDMKTVIHPDTRERVRLPVDEANKLIEQRMEQETVAQSAQQEIDQPVVEPETIDDGGDE